MKKFYERTDLPEEESLLLWRLVTSDDVEIEQIDFSKITNPTIMKVLNHSEPNLSLKNILSLNQNPLYENRLQSIYDFLFGEGVAYSDELLSFLSKLPWEDVANLITQEDWALFTTTQKEKVEQSLIINLHMPSEIIYDIAQGLGAASESALVHRNLSTGHQLLLAKSLPLRKAVLLLSNPERSAEVVQAFFDRATNEELLYLREADIQSASRSSVSSFVLSHPQQALAKKNKYRQKAGGEPIEKVAISAELFNGPLPDGLLERLLQSGKEDALVAVACSEKATKEQLTILSRNEQMAPVRAAAAANRNLPETEIRRLLHDKVAAVRLAAVQNPQVGSELLFEAVSAMLEHKPMNPSTPVWTKVRKKQSAGTWDHPTGEYIINDEARIGWVANTASAPSSPFRDQEMADMKVEGNIFGEALKAAASSPKMTGALARLLLTVEHPAIQYRLASNEVTPPEVLSEMSAIDHDKVKKALLRNSFTPTDQLRRLIADDEREHLPGDLDEAQVTLSQSRPGSPGGLEASKNSYAALLDNPSAPEDIVFNILFCSYPRLRIRALAKLASKAALMAFLEVDELPIDFHLADLPAELFEKVAAECTTEDVHALLTSEKFFVVDAGLRLLSHKKESVRVTELGKMLTLQPSSSRKINGLLSTVVESGVNLAVLGGIAAIMRHYFENDPSGAAEFLAQISLKDEVFQVHSYTMDAFIPIFKKIDPSPKSLLSLLVKDGNLELDASLEEFVSFYKGLSDGDEASAEQKKAYFINTVKSRPKSERSTAEKLHDLAADVARRLNQESFRLDHKTEDPVYQTDFAKKGVLFTVEDTEYRAKLAVTSEELMDWGDSSGLSVCVGNGTYATAAANGVSYLIGVYKQNKIYGCIEVDVSSLNIVQAKLERNASMEGPLARAALAWFVQAKAESA